MLTKYFGMLKYNPTPSEKEVIMTRVNDGFKLSTAATKIALNNKPSCGEPGKFWSAKLVAKTCGSPCSLHEVLTKMAARLLEVLDLVFL